MYDFPTSLSFFLPKLSNGIIFHFLRTEANSPSALVVEVSWHFVWMLSRVSSFFPAIGLKQ